MEDKNKDFLESRCPHISSCSSSSIQISGSGGWRKVAVNSVQSLAKVNFFATISFLANKQGVQKNMKSVIYCSESMQLLLRPQDDWLTLEPNNLAFRC